VGPCCLSDGSSASKNGFCAVILDDDVLDAGNPLWESKVLLCTGVDGNLQEASATSCTCKGFPTVVDCAILIDQDKVMIIIVVALQSSFGWLF